jgi:type I restriction enzyme S subunit
VRSEIAEKHSRSSIREGDVLLCIIRSLRVAIVPAGLDGVDITQGMVRIRAGERVHARYLAAYLESPHAQRWMKDQYVGLAMPRINVRDARAIPIAVPPPKEQLEIRRLGRLLGPVQTVALQIDRADVRLEQSRQSILAKAF